MKPDFTVKQTGDSFKILQFTDTQIIDSSQSVREDRLCQELKEKYKPENMNELLFDDMDKLVRETSPDLIVVTGDIIVGEFDGSGKVLRTFADKMDSYGVPWAPAFGNHDNECVRGVNFQCELLKKSKRCLFEKGTTTGFGNYTIGITDENGKLLRLVFMMDTNGCLYASEKSLEEGVKNTLGFASDQMTWLENTYRSISEECGEVPSVVCFHIVVRDFVELLNRKGYFDKNDFRFHDITEDENDFGSIHEMMNPGTDPISVLSSFKKAHVDGAFFGHSHKNDASVYSDGIRWSFGVKTGRYDYHEEDKTGGLVMTFTDNAEKLTVTHNKIVR